MLPFRTFSDFISEHFTAKMQKITVNGGFPCPNRDGTIGSGGCIYCNNHSFSPAYCLENNSVSAQIEAGKQFFAKKYPRMRFLAYFQSFTGTNAPVPMLMEHYRQAVSADKVDGLIIGTRPDCVPQHLLEQLASTGKFTMLEYGAESTHNRTLLRINRCHTWQQTVDAVTRTHDLGLPVGLHFIMGLPGENKRMMMQTIDRINTLPVDVVKFHQLQIIRNTELALRFHNGTADVTPWEIDEYLDLCCEIVNRLRPGIAIERFVSQAPDSLLIAPRWGVKNHEFIHKLLAKLSD